MATSVTLRQEKTILTGGPYDLYRVVSRITEADPAGLYPLFKVSKGIYDYTEIYQNVVGIDDLTQYVENELVALQAAAAGEFTAIGTVPGDTLEITNAPSVAPEWFDSFFTSAIFTIDGVATDGATVYVKDASQDGPPFPTATSGLTWEVRDGGGTPRGSGSGAYTRRNDLSTTTYLRRHWTSVLNSVAAGGSRVAAIEALVESLVEAAKVQDISFAGVETKVYE
jgi:hypothetical protein